MLKQSKTVKQASIIIGWCLLTYTTIYSYSQKSSGEVGATEQANITGVVWSYTPRRCCNKRYVGESKRNFEARGKVHRLTIKK